jgi:hypothetical protein
MIPSRGVLSSTCLKRPQPSAGEALFSWFDFRLALDQRVRLRSCFVVRTNTLVTDATGVVWQTQNIAEAAATVSLYTMVFAAALAPVKLVQRSAVCSSSCSPSSSVPAN